MTTARAHLSTRSAAGRSVPAAALGLAVAAWWVSHERMAGMDAGPGTDPGSIGFFITTWTVMMAAMMLPAVTPIMGKLGVGLRSAATVLIAYLGVWAAVGLVAYGVLTVGRALAGGVFAWHVAGRATAAGVVLLAAAYQLTPVKRRCLRRCRSLPRREPSTLRAGARYAIACVGCSWALMAALFALGEMSVAWMAVVATLIAGERVPPHSGPGRLAAAATMAALAIGIAVAPARVPALTIPGSPASLRAMHTMTATSHEEAMR